MPPQTHRKGRAHDDAHPQALRLQLPRDGWKLMNDISENPSTNGGVEQDERNSLGQFVKGWRGGPGSPYVRQVATWRAAMATVSEDDLLAVVQKLVQEAKAGQPWAVRELLDRCLGKFHQTTEISGEPTTRVRIALELDEGPGPKGKRRLGEPPP